MSMDDIPLFELIRLDPYRERLGFILSYHDCDPDPPHWLTNCDLSEALAPIVLFYSTQYRFSNYDLPDGFTNAQNLHGELRNGNLIAIKSIYGVPIDRWDEIRIYNGYGFYLNRPKTIVYWILGYEKVTASETLCR